LKLEVQDLSFGYRASPVFEHVSFALEGVGFAALIGPNGAGKSTLLKCLNGILQPSSGRVLLDGRDVREMHLKERAKRLGYVPQHTNVNPCLNVLETVVSGRMPHMNGKATHKDIEIAESILEEMGLESFATRPLHQLSGGERQRILIARALAQEPEMILLDEPTSNLDLRYALATMELLSKVCKEKEIGMLAVIHDLNSVLRHCNPVLLLRDHHLARVGAAGDIITEECLRDTFRIRAAFPVVEGISTMVPMESIDVI